MRRLFLWVLLATVSLWSQVHPPSAGPFSITITAPPAEVKMGKEIEIKIRLTNVSDHKISVPEFYENGVNVSYSYDVRDDKGQLVAKKSKRRFGGSVGQRTVRVGESVEVGTLVSRVFDMSRPGQYVIHVSRPIPDDPNGGVVTSNTLYVTVTP